MADSIPGIDRKLTRRQRTAARKRINEIPFLFRPALLEAVETGYLPDSTVNFILDNEGNPIAEHVLDELYNL